MRQAFNLGDKVAYREGDRWRYAIVERRLTQRRQNKATGHTATHLLLGLRALPPGGNDLVWRDIRKCCALGSSAGVLPTNPSNVA